METAPFREVLATVEQLREHYRAAHPLVQKKKVGTLDDRAAAFVRASPFCLLATAGADGSCDVSPRGGPAGFVRVLDERRLAIPDLSGNNLLDSLENIVANPRCGVLVVLPGRDETLRIDGRAWLTRDPDVLALWEGELRAPRVAIGVEVEHAFIHCAKSFRRGAVWDPTSWAAIDADAPDACEVLESNMGLDLPTGQLRATLEQGYTADLASDRA